MLKGILTGFSRTPLTEHGGVRTWDIEVQFEGYPSTLYDAFVSRDSVLVEGSEAYPVRLENIFVLGITNVLFKGLGDPPELHNGVFITVN